jgi:uncharacterized protein (TIGR03089 family)
MADVASLLGARVRRDGASPLVTSITEFDGRPGRTELSAVSLANAAAKIANALRGELDLEPGDTVVLDLPLHWQLAAWQAGIWTAGLAISSTGDAAVHVTSLGRADSHVGAAVTLAVSLHPFGLPIAGSLPEGVDDATLLVRQQPDAYLFEPPSGELVALLEPSDARTQQQLIEEAAAAAAAWGLGAGGRLLVTESADLDLAVLAAPLAAGAASVLVGSGLDDPQVRDQERVTAEASEI